MPSEQPEWRRSLRKRPAPLLEEPVAVNTEFVAHTKVEGRLDGIQLQFQTVADHHYLYVGHIWSGGVSILDVTNPADPQVAAFIPTPNESTKHTKVQVADGIAMIGCEAPMFDPRPDPTKAWLGVRFFDVSDPTDPKDLSFWASDRPGFGVHRSWWNGGRYAFLSHGVAADGFMYAGRPDRTRIMTTLDISDPENPRRVSDFWLPVQRGEGRQPGPGETFGVHEPVIDGNRAYIAYADGGFAIADISDIENPTLVTHQWIFPELTDGQTHTCVPWPERDLMVVSDEAMATFGLEGEKNIMIWDIADETDPRLLSMLPVPTPTEDEPYETYFHKGERFGPHGTHDNHQGKARITDKVYNAYMNAGLRVWDVTDPAKPVETASFVPADPTEKVDPRPYNRIADPLRGGTRKACNQDVVVDPRGYIYLSGYNDGIWIVKES
ncbi:MAG: LVIVD repeat-containing protein [Acidimicrobiia bacterium]